MVKNTIRLGTINTRVHEEGEAKKKLNHSDEIRYSSCIFVTLDLSEKPVHIH